MGGDTSPTSKEGPRPAETPVNELKPPTVDVIVTQEEEDVEQTVPVLSTDISTSSDQELQSLEATSTEVKAPVSVIVTADAEDFEKTPQQESLVDVKVTEAILSSTSEKSISQEELTESTEAVETLQPIKVIVTQEEEEEEEALRKNNEDIVRLEELAAKAKALASWKRAVGPARKPAKVAEEKTDKSEGSASVEEAQEIVASDNLKVIDPAAEVLVEEKAAEENTADSKKETEETLAANKEEFDFEESLGWTVQGRKGRKGKKGLSKLKGIISELKAEEAEKKEVIEEPKVLSFEEAAKQVEAESAFSRRTFAAPQSVEVKEDVDTDSSGWEVIEVSDDSEDEVKEVTEVTKEVKEMMSEEEKGCSGQRWVEEMNEKNRKKMELESKATDASASYSQSTFWREPISQLPNMPSLPKEEKMEEVKKVEDEKKPAGISLPISEMTYGWMDDDDVMGSIDTDEEDVEEKEKKLEEVKPVMSYADAAKKVEEVKPKGNALPTEDLTEAMGTMNSGEDDDVLDNRENLTLDLIPEKKKDEVPEQFSPVQYWRDPIPDILDPEEPLKNAEKSEKKSEKPKPITPKVAKPKSWLASNMAGMFDRKPKPKVKAEEVVAKKKESEKKTPPTSSAAEIKEVKPTISSSSTVTEVKSVTKEEKKEKATTIQREENEKQSKPKNPCDKESVWLDKWKFDDAEARFYEKESRSVERESSSTEVGNKKTPEKDIGDTRRKGRIVKEITEETHEKVEVVYKVPEKMWAPPGCPADKDLKMDNKDLKEKLTSIEAENKEMRKSLAQLSEHIRALTARVNLLEKEVVV